MKSHFEIRSETSDKNKIDHSKSQEARLQWLRAEHQQWRCDESKKDPTLFEQQRQRQQKELSQKAKVNYDDPTVPRLGGGMDKTEQKSTMDFLTRREEKYYHRGYKRSQKNKKEEIALEVYNIAVSRNKRSLTDKEVEKRINALRQTKRYKEAFGDVAHPKPSGESSHSEATSSEHPHTQVPPKDDDWNWTEALGMEWSDK